MFCCEVMILNSRILTYFFGYQLKKACINRHRRTIIIITDLISYFVYEPMPSFGYPPKEISITVPDYTVRRFTSSNGTAYFQLSSNFQLMSVVTEDFN